MISVGNKKFKTLNEALASIKSKTRATVQLPSGDHPLTSKVTLPSNVSITGVPGEATRILLEPKTSVKGGLTVAGYASLNFVELVVGQGSGAGSKPIVAVPKGSSLFLASCAITSEDRSRDCLGLLVDGIADIRDSTFLHTFVEFTATSSGKIAGSTLHGANVNGEQCGLALFGTDVSVEDCKITGYSVGAAMKGDSISLNKSSIAAITLGVDIGIGDITITSSTISASDGRALKAGALSSSKVEGSTIEKSRIGVTLEEKARMEMTDCELRSMERVGVRVESQSSLVLDEVKILGSGEGEGLDAVTTKNGKVTLTGCEISGISGRGIVVQGLSSKACILYYFFIE